MRVSKQSPSFGFTWNFCCGFVTYCLVLFYYSWHSGISLIEIHKTEISSNTSECCAASIVNTSECCVASIVYHSNCFVKLCHCLCLVSRCSVNWPGSGSGSGYTWLCPLWLGPGNSTQLRLALNQTWFYAIQFLLQISHAKHSCRLKHDKQSQSVERRPLWAWPRWYPARHSNKPNNFQNSTALQFLNIWSKRQRRHYRTG